MMQEPKTAELWESAGLTSEQAARLETMSDREFFEAHAGYTPPDALSWMRNRSAVQELSTMPHRKAYARNKDGLFFDGLSGPQTLEDSLHKATKTDEVTRKVDSSLAGRTFASEAEYEEAVLSVLAEHFQAEPVGRHDINRFEVYRSFWSKHPITAGAAGAALFAVSLSVFQVLGAGGEASPLQSLVAERNWYLPVWGGAAALIWGLGILVSYISARRPFRMQNPVTVPTSDHRDNLALSADYVGLTLSAAAVLAGAWWHNIAVVGIWLTAAYFGHWMPGLLGAPWQAKRQEMGLRWVDVTGKSEPPMFVPASTLLSPAAPTTVNNLPKMLRMGVDVSSVESVAADMRHHYEEYYAEPLPLSLKNTDARSVVAGALLAEVLLASMGRNSIEDTTGAGKDLTDLLAVAGAWGAGVASAPAATAASETFVGVPGVFVAPWWQDEAQLYGGFLTSLLDKGDAVQVISTVLTALEALNRPGVAVPWAVQLRLETYVYGLKFVRMILTS